jgi:methylase of polypeptide subunit release factors
VDCGTGTGLIAGWLSERTDRRILAIDRYRDPLELAEYNRSLNGWEFPLVVADRLEGPGGPFAAVVANLPYVLPDSGKVVDSVTEHEPVEALYVPGDPVSFYAEFIDDALGKLCSQGELWLEGAPPLFQRIEVILADLPAEVSFLEDTAGHQRYLRLTRSTEGLKTCK